ncbi:energy transducer TonB [Sphingomonas fuzhouensis]|uniref:energy transducer TonB n=1 Tax=Sphingomonas fuzhouensis TaxID=3106033 RepID=UPI002AFED046|nr:energy transducer TonB [Sphingomonas sp. SGZ-02]
MTSGRYVAAGLAGLAAVTGAAAMAQQGASAPAPAQTLQQQYDAATALDQGKDAAAALAAWTKIAGAVKQGGRTWAIATVRKGGAQYRLGQLDEAAATIRTGLAALPTTDATLTDDRYNAYMMLGRVAAESLDYADAVAQYGKAEAIATDDITRLAPMMAAARVQTFTDPAGASALLDRADAIAARTTLTKVDQAALLQTRMRLAMNTGKLDAANAMGPKVISLLGGMGLDKVSLRDVAARSDAAIAALLLHHEDKAREYMAYTGAGRSAKGQFQSASLMTPPECGGEADLKPEDVAIVQFGVGDDGSTFGVEPIYSSGGGEKGLAFARAVKSWAWTPEDMKDLAPFFRYSVRLEMRCSTAYARPSVGEGFDASFAEWLTSKGLAAPGKPEVGEAALVRQRAALAAAEAKGQAPATLAAIRALMSNRTLGSDERTTLVARADQLMAQTDMPAMARLFFAIPAQEGRIRNWGGRGRYAAAMTPLLSEKPYADDPQARAALRLLIADHEDGRIAEPFLDQVVNDGGLGARDPLKVGALIRLASLAKRRGDLALARETFAKSGLAASQCATLDATPKAVTSPGGDAFPEEARRWGFEGWVRNEYDIDADGRAKNARTIVSYPPFIFSEAAERMFSSMRYQKTFRPDGGLGCGANSSGVRFQLPG